MKPLRNILQSLNNINYLRLKSLSSESEEMHYNISLLKNGMKLRDELVNQWVNTTTSWAFKQGDITKNQNPLKDISRISFFRNVEFQNLYKRICKLDLSNPIVIKTIFNNVNSPVKDDIISYSENQTLLVSEYFVPSDSALSKFYNLQRERKIWWMRFSANASRYYIEPFNLSSNDGSNEICEKSKSITIKGNFSFGLVDMEHITLVPLHELSAVNLPVNNNEMTSKISLLRSVINLDFTTCGKSLFDLEFNSLF